MKLCEFCSNALSAWIYDLDGEMPYDKYLCSHCPNQLVYVFLDDIHLANEYSFPIEQNSQGQTVKEYILRQTFADDIPKGYFRLNRGTGAIERHVTTWVLEVMEYTYPTKRYNPLVVYRSNETTHLTPFNVKNKLETILTFM